MAENKSELILLFGGQSPEHDVSCSSARHVLAAAPTKLFDVTLVGIDHSGTWHKCLTREEGDSIAELPETLSITGPEITPHELFEIKRQTRPIVFPVLHGPNGEDGTIQGLLESFGVPYVGSGVLSSALCMDKIKSKELMSAHGVPQVSWLSFSTQDSNSAIQTIDDSELIFPLFVKPANMGSSIGISKVAGLSEVEQAINHASQFDDWVIVEQATAGREIEIAILEGDEPEASNPGEIVPGADFYDYNDKYEDGAILHVPAELSPEEIQTAQSIAVNVFELMRCDGLARIDFFYEESGRGWLVNEINTMPGFTPISMYPKLWEETGLSYENLILRLIQTAKTNKDP